MTKTSQLMTKTPEAKATPNIDFLSDLLGSLRLTDVVLFHADFFEPWAVITPDSCGLARVLPIRTEHMIPFHVIASGGFWLELPNGQREFLSEGSAVLLPYGDTHILRGEQPADPVSVGSLLPPPPWHGIQTVRHGGKGAVTRIICGFLQCDEMLFHPLLRNLPPLLQVTPGSDPENNWLVATIRHAANEASLSLPGTRSMLSRLTELMFLEVLRKYMQSLTPNKIGWFAALKDPVVGAALRLLHTKPMDNWDVNRLATAVGASRTVLSDRFKNYLSQPPMQYLTGWRLRLSAQALKTSTAPIKAVALESGYESEAAFSRAFKKHFGSAPADWRKQQLRE